MLHGRRHELAAIDRLLDATRGGAGGGLVVRGAPGIGKSALLATARSHAAGMRVLSTVGVEAESALGYATLQELLRPVLDRAGRLPTPQAHALRVAFGLEQGTTPNRFLVSLAALTLLSEAAAEQPVLCVVDDAHWADAPSLAALGFAARRLATEPVALLLAVHDAASLGGNTVGLAELRLDELAPEAAAALLDERWGDELDPKVRRQLLDACAGNPLALIELPAMLTGEQRAGRAALADPLPLSGGLSSTFARRIYHLNTRTRTLLLLVAAEGSGRLPVLRRAAHWLGLNADLLESEALSDAVSIQDTTLRFAHPLLRSAVYHGAEAQARRAVHRALAAVLSEEDASRSAWHHAHATDGPDERVAAELEASAQQTLRRSGHAAAATALERAAELSPASEDQARRLTGAADAAWRGGATAHARGLLDRALKLNPSTLGVRLDLQYLRGVIELAAGSQTSAADILVDAAAEAATQDHSRALRLLLVAGEATYRSGQWEALAGIGKAATDLAHDQHGDLAEPEALMLRMLAVGIARSAGLEALGQPIMADWESTGFAAAERLEDPVLLGFAGELAWGIGDDDLAYRLLGRAVERARSLGAAGTLAWLLELLSEEEVRQGRLAIAQAHALEGRQLAQEAGWPNVACRHQALLAMLAALRGQLEQTRRLAEGVLAEAADRHLVHAAATARRALGLAELGAGNSAQALAHFGALWAPGPLPGHLEEAARGAPELVQAAVDAGEPERARRPLEGFLTWASGTGTTAVWPALAARCRALLATSPQEAEQQFTLALELHGRSAHRPVDHARTHLLYGEFLRRRRRRTQARTHLRSALEVFERLGLPAWAERARRELRATGETARRRDPGALDQLTPQELQIVAAVAEGASNREVAARLFITPRTVAYHLSKLFGKLGIGSRADLLRLVHEHDLLHRDQADTQVR